MHKVILSIIANNKGQALVEMALLLPVFFLMVFGFLQLGIAIGEKQKLLYVTNYATQIGSLTNNDLKIGGAIEEFYDVSDLSFFIENRSAQTNDSISSLDRRYNDILTIKTEIPFSLSIPFIEINIIELTALASARVLCSNRTSPHTCE